MEFNKILQLQDSNFESILEIMKLKKNANEVEAVRNLLCVTNYVIDCFMDRDDDDLKIPVVYFPISTNLAQELCEDFVVLKMGMFSSKSWKNEVVKKLSKPFEISINVNTPKKKRLAIDNKKYEKKLKEILNRSINEYTECGKSLIYSENLLKSYNEYSQSSGRYNSSTVNKYWYLKYAISGKQPFNSDNSPLSLVYGDEDEFYNSICEEKNNRVENIIVFPSKTPDGRYSNFCAESFQKPYLDDFIESGCGLKNVFFFCFSRKPYRLRRLYDFKDKMRNYLQVFEGDSYEFISFTHKEALDLYGKEDDTYLKINLGYENNDIQSDYELIFDDLTNGLQRSVSRRNELSICFKEELSNDYLKKFLKETEADENILKEVLKINNRLWDEDVETEFSHFVYNEEVFIITGNDVDKKLKYSCGSLLKRRYHAKKVLFGTFVDLRGYLNRAGIYENKIQCKRIIIMSFRNDYTDSIFHKYPNSFDPYCINKDQQLLEISNFYYLRQYYEWGRYNYTKAIQKVINTNFRKNKMKYNLDTYKKPTHVLPEDTYELENDTNVYKTVKRIKISYQNNTSQEFPKSEWMLFKYNKHMGIKTLSELYELSDSANDLHIQPLSPLVRRIYTKCIEEERENDNRQERIFKEQELYDLSQDEINSDRQLWKILLEKKIKIKGYKNVYEEIMENLNEKDRVDYNWFKKWLTPEYGIPNKRKVQKFLIEIYLGIRPPYLNLIRRIKERTKSETEEIYIKIRHFLNVSLFNNNLEDVFNLLSDEIKELLEINSTSDIERVLENVKSIIKLEPIKSIEQ